MSNKNYPMYSNTPFTAEINSQPPVCDNFIVIVKVPKEQIGSLDTEKVIRAINEMPHNATARLLFQVLSADQRELWEIEEIRGFVQKALTVCPQILARVCLVDRFMMRNCVCDVAYTFDLYPNSPLRLKASNYSRWLEIAHAAGVDPMIEDLKINQSEHLHVFVTKEEVQKLDMRAITFIADLTEGTEVLFSFYGYDYDPREVWEIPEVAAYVRHALSTHTKFISRLDPESKQVIFSCHCWDTCSSDMDGTRVAQPAAILEWEQLLRTAGIELQD